jgi:hypothetical protein
MYLQCMYFHDFDMQHAQGVAEFDGLDRPSLGTVAHLYVCMYVCMYVYKRMCVCVIVCVQMYVYVYV